MNKIDFRLLFGCGSYSVENILTMWGAWSRQGTYSRYKSFSLEKMEGDKRPALSDDEADIVNSAICALTSSRHKPMTREKEAIIYYYYGVEVEFNDEIIIKPLNIMSIAKKMKVHRNVVTALLQSGESFIAGAISNLTTLIPDQN